MFKFPLPTLLATTLLVAFVAPAPAQKAAGKPKAASAIKGRGESEEIASVNGKPITWGQLIARVQKENEKAFSDAVAQAVGQQVATGLFGPGAKSSVTITKADALAALKKQPGTAIAQSLQGMIAEEALMQEAAKQNVVTTDAQVEARVKALIKNAREQRNFDKSATDEAFLKSVNPTLTIAKLKSSFRTQQIATNLLQRETEKKLGHPFGPGDYLQARHILIRTGDGTPDVKPEDLKKADEAAKAKITQIAADIKSGKKKFEDAAKESSDDPGSKVKGGDLGAFIRGMMVKEFEDSAFSLKPGEMSEPVKSQFGYHIIQVVKLGKDLTADERQKVTDGFLQGRIQPFVGELMAQRSKIINKLPAPSPQMGMMPPGGRTPVNPRAVRPGVRPGPPNTPNGQ